MYYKHPLISNHFRYWMLTKTNMENHNNQKIDEDMRFEEQIQVPIMKWLRLGSRNSPPQQSKKWLRLGSSNSPPQQNKKMI